MPYKDPDAQRTYQRERAARRRREMMPSDRCAQCGGRDNLQLDHIDPSTKVSHRIWSWSQQRIVDELRKCQVLCQECHQQKTNAQSYKPREHGTLTMYRHCHCPECRQAKARQARRLRATRAG